MLRPDIQAIAAKWIRLFRIQDRIITVAYVPNLVNPANGEPAYALMTVENGDEGRFRIEVQDPATWPRGSALQPTPKTIENAVRHECFHIRVRDFANGDVLAEERATWAISDAFDAIADGDVPNVAAMVVTQLARKTQTLSQIADTVRAMTANTAATRRQTKGRSMAMDPATAKMLLDALDSDDIAAVKAAIRKIAEDGLTGGEAGPPSTQDPTMPPMGADAGDKMQKDKPPMSMGDKPDQYARAMKAELHSIRTMKVEIEQYRNEAKAAADVVRPQAKVEIIRAMRAEGIEMTPDAEKRILDAPTVEVAKDRAESMRAMAPMGARKPGALPPNGGMAGLTRTQSATYTKMVANGNEKGAEAYRVECVKLNAAQKDGAK